MARWFSVFAIALVLTSCSSSTEIPTVAEDPWATPEEDAGPKDAGMKDEYRPPCGNGDSNCDPRNLGGETCAGLGMGNGKLACDPVTCTYDTSMCEDDTTTGMGNGGNGAGGGSGNNGSGNAGAGSSQPPFFGGGAAGNGNGNGNNDNDDDEADGGTPFFGGQFFGGQGPE